MTEPGDQSAQEQPTDAGGEYKPPASQAELDRIISDRVNRTKAQFKDYKDLQAAAAELEQIKAANQTAEQRQAEELTRWQTEAQTWRGAAIGRTVEALAAADFADPSDAVGQLDPGKYLDAGGQIDEAAIRADLADLLERKPHWRRNSDATSTQPRVPAPNRAQGSSATPPPGDPRAQFASILSGQLGSRQ